MKIVFKPFLLPVIYGTIVALLLLMPVLLCVPTYAEEDEAECWAVIVGVSDYAEFDDLDYCDDDARELSQELSPAWGEDHINVLLNDMATRSNIEEAVLGWLASKEDVDDTVLLFFAGHTYEETLFPYDSLLTSYDNDIWADDLNNWLNNLDSRKIVIIIDGCLSGSFFGEISRSGRVTMMAASPYEVAYEDPILGHGVFSYYILEALQEWDSSDTNHDYEISAEEIFYYAQPKVVSYTEATPPIQHPMLSDNYAGQLALLMKATFSSSCAMPSDATILTIDERICLGRDLPISFIWIPGSTHNLNIPSLVPGGEGIRYIFTSWNDGNTLTSRTISQGGAYTANYEKQYYLTIKSDYGKPEGEDWYSSGSMATISVTSPAGAIIRQVFIGWSGDYSGTTASASLIMDGPKTVTANWRTDYTHLYLLIVGGVVLIGGIAVGKRTLLRKRREKTVAPARVERITQPPATIYCTNCGTEIEPGDAFCAICGEAVKE